MKRIISNCIILIIAIFSSCTNGQNAQYALSVNEFSDKLKQTENAQLIDVRTPAEFEGGHLLNAINYNWNGDDFNSQIKNLDKQNPVFVYCLSGGRSGSAASSMRAAGFKTVYEMNGGMMKWRAAGLPESKDASKQESKGMTLKEYNKLTNTNKKVLVDFYAEWCAPCKKMKPYLEEIALEMKAEVTVIRIDADMNKSLLQELKIEGLPVLMLYDQSKLLWRNEGFIEKADVVAKLK